MDDKQVVLLSGFGPFGVHSVNASWESVKNVSKIELEEKYNIKIITVEIPVMYKEVDNQIPALWKKYRPILFIHVGVSSLADKITIETTANALEYNRNDCAGCLPSNPIHCCATKDCIKINCQLKIDNLINDFNQNMQKVRACKSSNAGRYLCEYIYFTSLSIDPSRALFVHVPDINRPYTLEELAQGLTMIVELCIRQIQDCKKL